MSINAFISQIFFSLDEKRKNEVLSIKYIILSFGMLTLHHTVNVETVQACIE